MLRQNANKLVLCCMLAVVLAVSVVLPSVTNSSNVAIADSSTTSYYSGNYYNSIDTSLRGDDFRDKLANLITTTHTTYTVYNGGSNLALNNVFDKTDKNPNGSGMVLFYTGTVVSSFSSSGANREHVWPKNGGKAFSAESECGSDAHHLRPCDQTLNSSRGSLSYGEVTDSVVKQGGSTSYGNLCYRSGSFFYPGEGYRGATARILMYVQTRWGNKFNLQFVDGAGHSKTIGDFKTLMKWHLEELPTQEEINRNQAVYEIQGNRNPFIDHPEYAAYIYSEAGSYYANNGTTMANEVNALLANNNPYGGQTNVEPTKLTLDEYSCTLEVGQSRALTLGVVPANGNKSVTWESKNNSVATVDQNGKITAVSTGTATIAAVSNVNANVAAYCVVTVVKPRSVVMVEVDGTPTKTVYNAGDKFDPTGLTVTVLFDSGDVETVPLADCKWTDGNTLEEKLSAGTTTVKCSYKGVTSDNIVSGITVNKVVAAQKTITITRSSFDASGSYEWHGWTTDGISGVGFIYAGTKDCLQMNSGKDGETFINTSQLVGGIKSVTLKLNTSKTKGNKQFTLFTSTKAFSQTSSFDGSHGVQTTSGGSVTWEINGDDTFFALQYTDSGVVYIESITITYGNAAEECEHVAGEWETEKAATCAADGSRVQKCTKCGIVLKREILPKVAHIAGEWTETAQPTCSATGTKVQKCTQCGMVLKTETVDKIAHSLVHHEAKAATCSAVGYEAYDECENCDYTTYREIARLAHTEGEWQVTESTCTTDGRRVQRCSVCNEVLHSETIAATGHAYGEWTVRTEPTETTDGLKERMCEHCDDVQTEVVPATGSDKPDPIDPNPDKPDTDNPGDDKNSGGMTISCNSVITSSAAILLAAAVVPVAIAVKRKRD